MPMWNFFGRKISPYFGRAPLLADTQACPLLILVNSASMSKRPRYFVEPSWVPNQPTNSLHVVIIPPPSQFDCSCACVFPVSFVKRSAVAPTELICFPSGGTTDKICFARSRISFDIILPLKICSVGFQPVAEGQQTEDRSAWC